MRLLALPCLLLMLACGCGSDDEPAATTPPAPSLPSDAASKGRLTARPPAQPTDPSTTSGLRRLGRARLYVPGGEGAKRLVVTLHGAGGGPDEAIQLLRPYADGAGLILLAPKSSGTTWDVAQSGFGPDVTAVDALLTQVFSEYAVDDVAVAGFSDGASYALSLGLTNGDLFRSVVAFSPGFIAFAEPNGMPRLFISHGVDDSILPIGRTSRRGVPRLRAAGYNVRYREFDGDHEVPPRIAREAVAWLGA
jgi:phospholipase/carboxylesterase